MSTERLSRHPVAPRLAAFLSAVLLLALTALAACSPSADDRAPDETVDVEPVADVPEVEDPKEIPRGQGLSGILPGGFPEDLPLYLPASLIDYGEANGRPWVDLLTPRSQAVVEKGLRTQVGAAGWQVESGEGGVLRVERDGRTAVITVRDGNPGTVYRIEY